MSGRRRKALNENDLATVAGLFTAGGHTNARKRA